nr:DUF2314 domain-containing protein [Pedobacter sp. ASV2]
MSDIEINEKYLYNLYKAKSTLWYFVDQLKTNLTNYKAIKFKNQHNVFVWLENVTYENAVFNGALSENNKDKNVPMEEVIDWMLVEDNRLIGGYTIRHYRETLTDEERLNFDIDFGLKIDKGNDVFYPDLSTLEGAIIMLENFYTEQSLDGALSCKDFYEESKNVLLEAGQNLEEQLIQETAALLKLAFIENLQHNGMPNFANVERVFERLLSNKEENKQLIEEKLIYPNGRIEVNRFWVAKNSEDKWKVLDMVEN